MALQVWLPLNGNLNNQGLSDITVINDGATVDNNGKIGKCYNFNGTSGSSGNTIYIPNFNISNTEFSASCWVNIKSSINGGSDEYIVCLNNNNYSGDMQFAIFHRTKVLKMIVNNTEYTIQTLDLNKWYHITLTFSNNIANVYINGELVNTKVISSTAYIAHNLNIGSRSSSTNGSTHSYYSNIYVNDVRIYNHRLSPKEVKEISKGLVLHYKLGNIYNKAYISPNLYSELTAVSLGLIPTITSLGNGKYRMELSRRNTSSDSIRVYFPLNLLQDHEADQFYYQFKYKRISGTGDIKSFDWCDSSINSQRIQKNSCGNYTQVIIKLPVLSIARPSINYDNTYRFLDINYLTEGDVFEIWDIKFEMNDHWTMFSLVGEIPSNIIYDCSGYGYNGTITGILSLNTDSPRYNYSTYFDGSSYIKTNPGELVWTNFDTLTISAWMKPTIKPSSYTGSIGIGHNSSNAHKYISISNCSGIFTVGIANGTYTNIRSGYTCPLNEWHHYAATLNETELKMYVDGVLKKTDTLDWNTATIHPNPQFQVGVDLPGTDEIYTGYYSDVRIYSTALSEKSIKELYNISGYVDNSGDVFQYESEERCENLFKLEYWNETINLTRSGNKYVTYTDRNGSKAFPLNASWFYYGSNDERNYHLQGKFKENTQYKFDFWIDYDDIMLNGNNTHGGLTVYYTDGTSNNVLRGTGNSETPMGWQHKYFISAENKTIKGICVFYNVQIPAFYRWDSTIVEIDNKSTKINKNGINSTGQFRECSDIAKINKGNHFDTNQIIEI